MGPPFTRLKINVDVDVVGQRSVKRFDYELEISITHRNHERIIELF